MLEETSSEPNRITSMSKISGVTKCLQDHSYVANNSGKCVIKAVEPQMPVSAGKKC